MPFKMKNEAGEEVEILTSAEQAEMITGAVRGQLDKATKKLTTDLTASLGASLAETLTAYEAKREEAAAAAEAERIANEGEGGKGKGKNKGGDLDIENSPAFKGLQKQLEAANKKFQLAEETAKAEKTKQRDILLRQKIGEELDKLKFDPTARHLALSHLVDGAKLARYAGDDSEDIVFRDSDGTDVDLTTGLKGFAQTDDGKRFMPASGASGTGDRSRFTPITQPKTGKLEPGTLGRSILAIADSAGSSGAGTG